MSTKTNLEIPTTVTSNSVASLPKSITTLNPKNIQIGLALLAVYVIWGSTYLGLRIAVETIPPFMMTGARFLLAGLLMFVFLIVRGAAMPTRLQWRNTALIGTLMLGVGTGGVAFAEQWVASGLAATAVASVPLWAAVFSTLFGFRPSRGEWIGVGVGLFGVVLLNLEQGMQANTLGAITLIVGPVSWAFGSMLSRRLEMPHGAMATATEMIGGGIALFILSLIVREPIPAEISMRSALAFVYLVTVGAIVAFTAYMYLLRTVRPTLATSYAYVNPVVAMILGAIVVNETITPIGILAMVVILGGVGLLAFSRVRQSQ